MVIIPSQISQLAVNCHSTDGTAKIINFVSKWLLTKLLVMFVCVKSISTAKMEKLEGILAKIFEA